MSYAHQRLLCFPFSPLFYCSPAPFSTFQPSPFLLFNPFPYSAYRVRHPSLVCLQDTYLIRHSLSAATPQHTFIPKPILSLSTPNHHPSRVCQQDTYLIRHSLSAATPQHAFIPKPILSLSAPNHHPAAP